MMNFTNVKCSNDFLHGISIFIVGPHGSPQTSAVPFALTVDKTTINSGDVVTLTLAGPSLTFKGFIVEALKADDGSIVGIFQTG